MKPRPPVPFPFDPTREDHAYFLGLLATDGHITAASRNRGRVMIELSSRDAAVLERLAACIPYGSSMRSRVRSTNFRKRSETVILSFFDLRLRKKLARLGYPAGRKSATVGPPRSDFNERGFWRGVIDGDGSLGITARNIPFVSLVTSSQALRDSFVDFAQRSTGAQLKTNRNTRDRVFNLMLLNEKAQKLAAFLYGLGGIAIGRKAMAASCVVSWARPAHRKLRTHEQRRWTATEDLVALSEHTHDVVALALRRTISSVSLRRWRLGWRRNGTTRQAQVDVHT